MGLIVNVLRANRADCTNGGISSKFDTLCVVNMDGPFEPSDRAAAVILTNGPYGTKRLRPAILSNGKWVEDIGKMYANGGNFAYTSDSRFSEAVGFYGAVAIHDRTE